MSVTLRNCRRTPPLSLIRAGQATINRLRVPPKWLAICFVHWNGVSMACAAGCREVVEVFRSTGFSLRALGTSQHLEVDGS